MILFILLLCLHYNHTGYYYFHYNGVIVILRRWVKVKAVLLTSTSSIALLLWCGPLSAHFLLISTLANIFEYIFILWHAALPFTEFVWPHHMSQMSKMRSQTTRPSVAIYSWLTENTDYVVKQFLPQQCWILLFYESA